MTVKQLINRLQDMPQDKEVMLEVYQSNPTPYEYTPKSAEHIEYDDVYETSDNMVCIQAWE